jgi:hypothetical protein
VIASVDSSLTQHQHTVENFGRFLNFGPTGLNLELLPKNLTLGDIEKDGDFIEPRCGLDESLAPDLDRDHPGESEIAPTVDRSSTR